MKVIHPIPGGTVTVAPNTSRLPFVFLATVEAFGPSGFVQSTLVGRDGDTLVATARWLLTTNAPMN